MKAGIVYIIIAVLIITSIVFYVKFVKGQNVESQSSIISSQADLLRAQTAAEEACKKNWLCATKGVLQSGAGLVSIF